MFQICSKQIPTTVLVSGSVSARTRQSQLLSIVSFCLLCTLTNGATSTKNRHTRRRQIHVENGLALKKSSLSATSNTQLTKLAALSRSHIPMNASSSVTTKSTQVISTPIQNPVTGSLPIKAQTLNQVKPTAPIVSNVMVSAPVNISTVASPSKDKIAPAVKGSIAVAPSLGALPAIPTVPAKLVATTVAVGKLPEKSTLPGKAAVTVPMPVQVPIVAPVVAAPPVTMWNRTVRVDAGSLDTEWIDPTNQFKWSSDRYFDPKTSISESTGPKCKLSPLLCTFRVGDEIHYHIPVPNQKSLYRIMLTIMEPYLTNPGRPMDISSGPKTYFTNLDPLTHCGGKEKACTVQIKTGTTDGKLDIKIKSVGKNKAILVGFLVQEVDK